MASRGVLRERRSTARCQPMGRWPVREGSGDSSTKKGFQAQGAFVSGSQRVVKECPSLPRSGKKTSLFACRVGPGSIKKLKGRVGSCQKVFKSVGSGQVGSIIFRVSWVGSGRVKR